MGQSNGQSNMGQSNGQSNMGQSNGQSNMGQSNMGQFNGQLNGQLNGQFNGQSNVGQFNMDQPNVGQFNMDQPNVGQFNMEQPNVGQFNVGQSNVGQSNGQLNVGQLNVGQSNVGQYNGQFNMEQPNVGQSNVGQFNLGQSNVGQFNLGQFNMGQTGIDQSNIGSAELIFPNLDTNLYQSNITNNDKLIKYFMLLFNNLQKNNLINQKDINLLKLKIESGVITIPDGIKFLEYIYNNSNIKIQNDNIYNELSQDFYKPIGDKIANEWQNDYAILNTDKWTVPMKQPPVCINSTPCKVCDFDMGSNYIPLKNWDNSRYVSNYKINKNWIANQ
jgi:hypothetical protein